MRLLPKLTLGILAASAVPLAIAGLTSARLSERSLRDRTESDHAALAANAAEGVARFFDGVTSSLRIYPQLLDLEAAAPDVLVGVLRLAYRAGEDFAIVSLLDDKGRERIESVFVADPAAARELGGRPLADAADRDAFLARVPVERALRHGAAVGEVVLTGPAREPRCAVAVAFSGASGRRHLLAADVSLRRLHRELGELSRDGREVVLVDARRRAVAGGRADRRPLSGVPLPDDHDPAGPLPDRTTVARVVSASGAPALAAFAPAGVHGYGVVVNQPEAVAFAHVRDLRLRALYWLGVSAALAVIVGVWLARHVSGRIRKVAEGTETLAQGRFDHRLDATGTDELAALARSFNKMAAELGRAHDEITRWNRELERRVAEKGRELERAQDLLLRSQSLAAIGTLGAGMAHEINNPLTGVLGAAQLLLLDLPQDSPTAALARDIETQAQRIRKIVSNLLRFAQRETGGELAPVDLHRVLDDALELIGRTELERAKIEVERRYAPSLPLVRGNAVQLQEVFVELLVNARKAMPQGGRIVVSTRAPGERLVAVTVADNGRGIEREHLTKIFDPFFTTKDNWTSTGMGLTLVHKIVEEHKGTIVVDSEVGRGSTFTVTFPAQTTGHLE